MKDAEEAVDKIKYCLERTFRMTVSSYQTQEFLNKLAARGFEISYTKEEIVVKKERLI